MYPLLAFGLFFGVGLLVSISDGSTTLWPGAVSAVFGLLVASPILFGFGYLYALAGALVVLPLVRLAIAVTGCQPRRERVATGCGATVGCLATLPLQMPAIQQAHADPVFAFVTQIAVGLAVLCGQAGGAIAAADAVRRRSRSDPRPFRFRLGQVMAATALASLVLGLAQVSHLSIVAVVYAAAFGVLVYLVTNRAVLWAVDNYLRGRFERRRVRRVERCST